MLHALLPKNVQSESKGSGDRHFYGIRRPELLELEEQSMTGVFIVLLRN